jgi:hypothetical protein
MPRKVRRSNEEQAVRLVDEHRDEYDSEYACIRAVATRVGVGLETLRKWVRQGEVDAGDREGVTTANARATRISSVRWPSWSRRNPKGRNKFLRAGERPATSLICAFIAEHRARFGVAPICRVLTEHGCEIAPRTFYAWQARPPSARALWEMTITEVLARYYEPDERGRRKPESLYGHQEMWAHLNRQGIEVARCTVERLMLANGWRGVTRAKKVRTTDVDPALSGLVYLFGSGR